MQETEDPAADPEKLWEEFKRTYPKIQPFEYEDGCDILTIRPQDIGKLPRECWVYGNNSFLLHGYYNFRYLILVKLGGNKKKSRYLLGVPGHYYSSEKYMATMVRFPEFRPLQAPAGRGWAVWVLVYGSEDTVSFNRQAALYCLSYLFILPEIKNKVQ